MHSIAGEPVGVSHPVADARDGVTVAVDIVCSICRSSLNLWSILLKPKFEAFSLPAKTTQAFKTLCFCYPFLPSHLWVNSPEKKIVNPSKILIRYGRITRKHQEERIVDLPASPIGVAKDHWSMAAS